jgi:hypothetical protein
VKKSVPREGGGKKVGSGGKYGKMMKQKQQKNTSLEKGHVIIVDGGAIPPLLFLTPKAEIPTKQKQKRRNSAAVQRW